MMHISQSIPTSMREKRRAPAAKAGEDGYILIGVLFLMVMVLIALSIAAPKVAADIERDREIELMHRGQQYRRAVQLYFRKFGAYPPNMEALEKSGTTRFLRKKYVDPATGKAEWHLIHYGEAKLPTMGFFGQPISAAGSSPAGVGPGGVGQQLGSPIGGAANPAPDPNAASNPANPGTPANPQSPGNPVATDPNAPAQGTLGSNTISSFGQSSNSGQTMGGLGIIGVESTSAKATILEYKKKKHFNEWEFTYDPQSDRQTISGNNGTVGTPIGGPGSSGAGTNPPSISGTPINSSVPPPQQQQQPTPQPQQNPQ